MGYNDSYTQAITGTLTSFNKTVEGPVDGYRAFASTVNAGFKQLIDNDWYTKAMILRGRKQLSMTRGYNRSGIFTMDGSSQPNRPYWTQTASTSSSPLFFDITDALPMYPTRIVNFGVYAKGNYHSIMPSVMPKIQLLSSPVNSDPRDPSNALSVLIQVTDPSSNVSEYQALHTIATTNADNLSVTTNTYTKFYIGIYGETNALASLTSGYFDISSVYFDMEEIP